MQLSTTYFSKIEYDFKSTLLAIIFYSQHITCHFWFTADTVLKGMFNVILTACNFLI